MHLNLGIMINFMLGFFAPTAMIFLIPYRRVPKYFLSTYRQEKEHGFQGKETIRTSWDTALSLVRRDKLRRKALGTQTEHLLCKLGFHRWGLLSKSEKYCLRCLEKKTTN